MSQPPVPLELIFAPFGTLGLISMVFAVYLYISLSRRLGAVTKMAPYYHWYLVSIAFFGLAALVAVLRTAAHLYYQTQDVFLTSLEFAFLFYHIPLLIGMGIAFVVTWRYWSWLLTGEKG